MISPEKGEFENSLETEKTRTPLWYGLGAKTAEDQSEIGFMVNAGGPNEAVLLAQQVCPDRELTGPYRLSFPGCDLMAFLNWKFGRKRQAIIISQQLRIPQPEE